MDVQKGELDFLLNNSGSHIITRNEVNQNIRHLKTNWLFFCDIFFLPIHMDFWNNIDFKKTYAAWSIYFLPWFQIYMQVEKQNNLGVGSAKRVNYRKIKSEYSRHILNQVVVFLHISLNSYFTFKMIRPANAKSKRLANLHN